MTPLDEPEEDEPVRKGEGPVAATASKFSEKSSHGANLGKMSCDESAASPAGR